MSKYIFACISIVVAIMLFSGLSYNPNYHFTDAGFGTYGSLKNNLDAKPPTISNAGKDISGKNIFYSDLQAGIIGKSTLMPVDNPDDNIFQIHIPDLPSENFVAYLKYDLFGISDYSGVARSVNSSQAVGGQFIKLSNKWSNQKETIPFSSLKKGTNLISFALPNDAGFYCRIKNVSIEIEPYNLTEPAIIVSEAGCFRSGKFLYISGAVLSPFPNGNNEQPAKLFCDGIPIQLLNGEFEAAIPIGDSLKNGQELVNLKLMHGNKQIATKSLWAKESRTDFSSISLAKGIVSTGKYLQEKAFSLCLPNSNDIGIDIPARALAGSTAISITALRDIDIPALNPDLVNVTKGVPAYRFLPHGTKFLKDAKISLPFDSTLIPDGYTADDIRNYYFDVDARTWVALPLDTVLRSKGIVVSRTGHFTDMMNGIIKVPESPQTQGYTPTSIKDIKAANPSLGIQSMEPPVANHTGGSSLSFPLKLPKGRGEMHPQLGIQYSNEAGNGWMGLGWSLSVPSIGIDTKLGVPRYDASLETENYTYNGQQLAPITGKAAFVARVPEKQFYPRVEGGFQKIIRHGNAPANYWWEVTDKTGTRNFYGGSPVAGVINNAVLKDDNGNIAQWGLVETRDLNGNFISYQYQTVIDVGLPNGTVPGKQLYISQIFYTGFGNTNGAYEIEFIRDRQLSEPKRKDIDISGRLGLKVVNADLLRKINVKYSGQAIRSYDIHYREGAFYKTLVKSISELDGGGGIFYTHSFNYFDDVQSAVGYVPLLPAENWSPANDNIKGDIGNPFVGYSAEATALNSSKSKNRGYGIAVTVGIANGRFDKSLTVGGNLSSSMSTSEGMIALIDIDGDNLPDKVLKQGGQLYYRKNFGSSLQPFGNKVPIAGINNFSSSKSSTRTKGIEVNPFVAFWSRTSSSTNATTSEYFSDFNGDKLIDIASNGTVYFNRIDVNGNPVFLPSSAQTPSPIVTGSNVSTTFLAPNTALQTQQENDFPLQDIVRMWIAPHNGTINVTAPVQLMNTNVAGAKKDGIRVSIQLSGNVLWNTSIPANDFSIKNPIGVNNINVIKGQRLYFRVQSIYNGEEDLVNWNPIIQYSNTINPSGDANNKPSNFYQASTDFVLHDKTGKKLYKDGTVKIDGNFTKGITSDTVRLIVIKETAGVPTIVFQQAYACSTLVVGQPILVPSLTVTANELLKFVLESDSYIDRSVLSWYPHFEYTSFTDGTPVTDIFGKPTMESYAVPDNRNYNDWLNAAAPLKNTVKDTVRLKPLLTGIASANGTISFTLKRVNNIVGKKTVQITNGVITGTLDSIPVIRQANETLYCDYHTSDRSLALAIQDCKLILLKDSSYLDAFGNTITVTKKDTVQANLYTEPAEDYLGTQFRGWGHFSFKGDPSNGPLIESKINVSNFPGYSNDPSLYSDSSLFNNIVDVSTTEFVPLYVDAIKNQWVGFDSSVFVSGTQMSSARLWVHDVSVDSLMSGGSLSCANKISETQTTSHSLGASIVLSAVKNVSKSSTTNTLDMMDFNGDGFPDVAQVNSIQYTAPSGGLLVGVVQHGLNAATFAGKSSSFTVGGVNPQSFAKNFLSVASSNIISNAASTIGMGVSFSSNTVTNDDEVPSNWMDINGDGLPDKVYDNGFVALNLGYKFAPAEYWGTAAIEKNRSENTNSGAGFSLVNGSFQAGFSLQKSNSTASTSYVDVNGDGLVDKLTISSSILTVQLNTGNGFGPSIVWNGLNSIRNSASVGQSVNAAFTIAFQIPIPFLPLKFCINPSVNGGDGVSREYDQISDIDGDGFPDVLFSANDGNLIVQRSTIGRTNMLSSVQCPMGKSFSMDYERMGNTYAMPQSKWVLKNVEVVDGFSGDGVDTMRMRFSYTGGNYNRDEREFYGFSQITTQQLNTAAGNAVYRSTVKQFLNSTYYNKGLQVSEWLEDAAGRKFTQIDNIYQIRSVVDSVKFPALVKTTKLFYEGNPTPGVGTYTDFDYDTLGNVTKINDFGNGSQQDILMAVITYHNNNTLYIKSVPASIEISDAGGIVRKRTTLINAQGDITEIKLYLDNSSAATYNMEYDVYGNLSKIFRPANYKGQRMWYAYTYDNQVNTYVTNVKDAFGYSSSSVYDYRFGELLGTTSIQGQPMKYTLDNIGRLVQITGPYEIAAGKPYTISFEYYPNATVPYAVTHHYDPEHNGDINTITFMDGLGRVLQIKKQASIFKAKNQPDDLKMIVSGKTIYDAFGRGLQSFFPATENIGAGNTTFSPIAGGVSSTTSYDVLDRKTKTVLADGATTTMAYAIASNLFSEMETDPLNNKRETLTDVKGRKVIVNVFGGPAGTITTKYQYNAMSELLRVLDVNNNAINYTYDNLGRQLSINHPDAGLTSMEYDLANNIVAKITPQIKKEIPNGGAIRYMYDFERLSDIDYPRQYQNKVTYKYGTAGMGNRTGRLILQEDATGGQEYFYGPLGEITKTIRTVLVNRVFYTTYVSEQEYDTWNRIKKMVYPDGEVVKYAYNKGGTLDSMSGYKAGQNYSYVKQLGYDEFEQRLYLQYGNGTETYYKYDSLRRRLINLKGFTDTGRNFMNNQYTYDAVSNVLDITNNIQVQQGALGGFAKHTYGYDNLYRLKQASGVYTGDQKNSTYSLFMTYDNLYNIVRKQMQFSDPLLKSYNNAYVYGGTAPHQPTQIGDTNTRYRYDLNGNLLSYGFTQNFWDEDNRLMAVLDNEKMSRFTYDASGERVVKSSGPIRGTWVNGASAGFISHDSNYTVYVSPYLVARRTGFTKHYYIESQRITTKLGIGRFNNISFAMPAITAGGVDYIKRLAQIERDRYNYYASLGISPGPPTNKYFYGLPENSGIAAPITVDSTASSIPPGWPGNTTPPPTGPPVFISPIPSNDSVKAGYGFVAVGFFYEQNQYFYHPDHLGSTAYVSNVFGDICQHQEYAAFGETFVDEHRKTQYLFNGKEKDEETGLYYYGARYYDARTSIWLSVDPLLDEPSQIEKSPYAYTWCNPIKYTDPDGRFLDIALDIGFIAYDIGKLAHDKITTGKTNSEDWAALGADVAGAAIPFATGGGMAIRAAKAAERASEVAKTVDKVKDVGKIEDAVKTTEGILKGEKNSSSIEYITSSSRGKSSTPNIKSDVKRSEFENNLQKAGYEKSTSKDGKANLFTKDGNQYSVRNSSKSYDGPSADFKKAGSEKNVDLKIRLQRD